jgi:acetoin utilization deacetylase AcuC-like enzyme
MVLVRKAHRFNIRDYGIDIPVSHNKTARALEALKNDPVLKDHIHKWYRESTEARLTKTDLLRVHSKEYIDRLFSPDGKREIMKIYELVDEKGFTDRYKPDTAKRPLKDLLIRAIESATGTYECCKLALKEGFCFYFGGGAHHAQKEYGNGFCIVNDVVLAVRKLQAESLIENAWIVDLDAHKGDGTAALARGDASVSTLSIHMAKGWPLDADEYDEEGRFNLSFTPSDIDIPIDSGEETLYIERLVEGLETLSGLSEPDIAVVLSGADPYEKDELPSTAHIRLTKEQLAERDRMVYSFLKRRGVPRAYLMAGGYGEGSWEIYVQFLTWVLPQEMDFSSTS